MPVRRTLIIALAASAAAAAPAARAQSPDGPGLCTLRAGGPYTVVVVRGDVSCRKAKRVLGRYLRHDRSPRGWRCRDGRRAEAWAAQCRSGKGSRPRRLVRAYAGMS